MSRSDRWTFTHNNPQNGWRPRPLPGVILYCVYQLERGEQTERQHIQGYVRFSIKRTLAAVKRLLGADELHLETARGSEAQNKEYCTKAGGEEQTEIGTYDANIAAHQGRRTDLEEVCAKLLMPDSTLETVAREHPVNFVRYHGGLQSLFRLTRQPAPATRPVTTTWLWGPTGQGKTHRVRTAYPDCFMIVPGRDPFGEYTDQDTVVFDEWKEEEWSLQEMNRLLDKWPASLNCRYYNKSARWTKVFIMTNSSPITFYRFQPEELRASFFRRITYTIEIKTKEQELLLL